MHKLLGGLCAALLFLAGLPQIGHTAEPVPLKTAWLGEHEAFAAWYAKQKAGIWRKDSVWKCSRTIPENSLWRA